MVGDAVDAVEEGVAASMVHGKELLDSLIMLLQHEPPERWAPYRHLLADFHGVPSLVAPQSQLEGVAEFVADRSWTARVGQAPSGGQEGG